MATTIHLPLPLTGCLQSGERRGLLGVNRDWQTFNAEQRSFIDTNHAVALKSRVKLRKSELASIADWDCNPVNEFLRNEGFSIQLTPQADDAVYMAARMAVSDKWDVKGENTDITCKNGNQAAGALFANGFRLLHCSGLEGCVAQLDTENGDQVFFTPYSKEIGRYALQDLIVKIGANAREDKNTAHDGFAFPKINLNLEQKHDWLLEMSTVAEDGRTCRIAEALQQTVLKVNETGFLCKSAAAMSAAFESVYVGPQNPYIIDRPFMMWIQRPGFAPTLPIFAGRLDYDVFGDPGDIDELQG